MAVTVPLSRRLTPPAGTYDPALDAQWRAAQRGYGDIQQDFDIAGSRASGDYATDRARAQQSYGRSLADMLRDRTRASQDKDRTIADINTGYTRMGRRQGEAAARAGVTQGGTLGAALAARTANAEHDRAPVIQNFDRFMQDSTQQEQRLGQDYNDPTTGLFARMDTDYARGAGDRALQLGRAGRENTFYGQDVADQRAYQAAQMGWAPPPVQRPRSSRPKLVRTVRQPTVRRRR